MCGLVLSLQLLFKTIPIEVTFGAGGKTTISVTMTPVQSRLMSSCGMWVVCSRMILARETVRHATASFRSRAPLGDRFIVFRQNKTRKRHALTSLRCSMQLLLLVSIP